MSIYKLFTQLGDDFQNMNDFMTALNNVITRQQRRQTQTTYDTVFSSPNSNDDKVEAGSEDAWSQLTRQKNFNSSRKCAKTSTDSDSASYQNNATSSSEENRRQQEKYEPLNSSNTTTYTSKQLNADDHISLANQYYSKEGIYYISKLMLINSVV